VGDVVAGQAAVGNREDLVAGMQQVEEGLGGRRIKVGKILGRLEEAFVARQVFEQEMRRWQRKLDCQEAES